MRARTYLLFLIIAACASCHREEAAKAPPGAATRPAKAPVQAKSATEERAPGKPLLHTKNIHISATGKMMQFGSWVGKDPEPVLADLATMPPSETKDRAMSSVLKAVAQVDPAKARDLLKQWPEGRADAWLEVAQAIARGMGPTQLAAVQDFISQGVPPSMQSEIWAAYMDLLPPADQLTILDKLLEGNLKLRIAAAMVSSWVPDDPAAVAAWLDGFAVGKSPREIDTLNEPWRTYGERRDTDPLAWLAAFHAAETPEAQQFFAENALRFASEEQKQQWQMEFAEVLPDLKARASGKPWDQDPAAWVAKLSPQDVAALPAEQAKELIRQWGQKNPRKALDWALAQGRPEAARALDLLYYQEPREAVALASGVPAGKERDEVLSTICDMAAFYGDEASARQLLPLISDQQQQDRIRLAVERRLQDRKAKR